MGCDTGSAPSCRTRPESLGHIIRLPNEILVRRNTHRGLASGARRERHGRRTGRSRYPVRRTPKRGLRQVDFIFEGNEIRGLEGHYDCCDSRFESLPWLPAGL
jgi:hypothetical protein